MIIKPHYTSESIEPQYIEDYDKAILEYLVSQYGSDIVFQSINESHYYGTGNGYNSTGGSKARGFTGFLKALPSFTITTLICWPIAVMAGVGAILYRMRHKYEDKDSWLNTLNPMYWVEYLATSHKDKYSDDSSNKENKSLWSRIKDKLFGVAGAGTSATLLKKAMDDKESDDSDELNSLKDTDNGNDSTVSDSSIDIEEYKRKAMNAIFIPYWVTLSNGEILRLRADSEDNAKMIANYIIANTQKTYNELNTKISQFGCPRYKFYFNDGEICYWSAPNKKEAYTEALQTRQKLCDALNNNEKSSIILDDLEKPNVEGKVEIVKGKPIDVPKRNKFLNITTTQPRREDNSNKPIPIPTYKYGSFTPYKTTFANFAINIPGCSESTAIDITKKFNSHYAKDIIRDIYDMMNMKYDLYKVYMTDGDIYVIPSRSDSEASRIALKLYNAKVESIKDDLKGSEFDEYENFLSDFGERLKSVKKAKFIDPSEGQNYTIKKGDVAKLYKVTDRNEKNERLSDFRL